MFYIIQFMDLLVVWSNRAESNITIHNLALHKMKLDRIGWN